MRLLWSLNILSAVCLISFNIEKKPDSTHGLKHKYSSFGKRFSKISENLDKTAFIIEILGFQIFTSHLLTLMILFSSSTFRRLGT